jgi:hypothetical protein
MSNSVGIHRRLAAQLLEKNPNAQNSNMFAEAVARASRFCARTRLNPLRASERVRPEA